MRVLVATAHACCSTDEADDLAEYASEWTEGTIMERRLEWLHVRCLPSELPA